MKAVKYDRKSPGKLTYTEVEKPIPNENEILVQVHSVSINAADYRMIQFGIPPKKKIFGSDVSGIVESVGSGVKNFAQGDEVIGILSDFGFGGFAEYAAAPEAAFMRKPNEVSFDDAAALPMAAVTALQAMRDKGNIKEGQQVLIVGSSGGVGTYAVQLAKHFGAIVTGVCSTKNVEQTRMLGADSVIDYKEVDISTLKTRYDLILGINGNYPLRIYKKLLNPNGKYVMVGGSLTQIFKSLLFGWILSFGSRKMYSHTAKSDVEDLKIIVKLASEGKIKSVIERSYMLQETPEAFQYIKEQHTKGKIVIKVK